MKDDRGAFEGAESMVGEVTALDLLSIEAVKAESAADVKNLLHLGAKNCRAIWEDSQDYYGAAIASRMAKHFILERMPFDSIGWMGAMGEADLSVGHPCGTMSQDDVMGMCTQAIDLLLFYLKTMYYGPREDDTGYAERQACVLATLYFVLGLLRYGCPADKGSMVTRMLRALPEEQPKTLQFSPEGVRVFSLQ